MTEPDLDPGVGPFADLLGVRRAAMADGRSRFDLAVRAEHMNPHGVIHRGGRLRPRGLRHGRRADVAPDPGRAVRQHRDQDQLPRAGDGRQIVADARVVARTTRIGVLDARVHDDGDRLIAVATGTFFIQGSRS